MKTSFYIMVWSLLFLFLVLINNSFIDKHALLVNIVFVEALAIVCGLSWFLNRLMQDTLSYERVLQNAPILEDVYTGNVSSFYKRLVRDCYIGTVTAIYFVFTTVVITLSIFKAGANVNIAAEVIYGIFTYGAISRSLSVIRAKAKLKSNPTPEQCMKIADKTYKLDYASYCYARTGSSYQDMLPSEPEHFKVYNVLSTVIPAIVALPGLYYIVLGILCSMWMMSAMNLDDEYIGAIGTLFLLGSLPAYFGVKDFVSCIRTRSNKVTISKDQTA